MPTLLVVDNDRPTVDHLRNEFEKADIAVCSTERASNVSELLASHHPDAVLLAVTLPDRSGLELCQELRGHDPGLPVILTAGRSAADTGIVAMQRGAFDYVVKPLLFPDILNRVKRAFRLRQHDTLADDPASQARPEALDADGFVGSCPAMLEVYKAIGRVASQKVNVLIRGESGTGKELVATAIQRHSPRSAARFLAVNCAAIPESLLESELFGHEKGSFTGANGRRIGKFEDCSGGTLFLDEVGDMTPLMQSKVLRVLQEGKFERIGGNETIETDVRIIAATHRDLEQMVAAERFRADLYYRLNVFSIPVPPLRERGADIRMLTHALLARICCELGRSPCQVAPAAMERLESYSWPGNVRELQSVLRRAVLESAGPMLAPEHIALPREPSPGDSGKGRRGMTVEEFVEQRLREGSTDLHADALAFMESIVLPAVLRHTKGNQSEAARILSITRGTLRTKLRERGIVISQAVSVEPRPTAPWTAP
ncbi:MAG: sigma-54-dependent transcriptional regulator [Planctomycetota bacterium]